eukprot:TRINITY_DN3044_c0_g1_i1.p1 TRINITY_DN3044_c0_g1~~TRINITY_DN3044_c0_g1_i1.p1  ORF type:complete len:191 (+),score=24.79 TRINITY_DN3044_c0_g1_i1:73-645(+)
MPLSETLYHTFQATWRDVFLASWLKYPSTVRPDILSVDIIKKEFDPETGILKARRLIMVEGFVPSWLTFLIGSNAQMFFVEDSIVNVNEKTFVLTTKNLTFRNVFQSEEICKYSIDPENANWTRFEQKFIAGMTSFIYGMANKVEQFCIDTAKKQSTRGREVMENAINKVYNTDFVTAWNLNIKSCKNEL